ncbi:hypothetical protein TYRP_012155 [Tyrophagus putrescentiae]|nr:hypothetical protein TYRP_012155 [Tyrophagus putrescentiae]
MKKKPELNMMHICDKLNLMAQSPQKDPNNSLLLQGLTLNSTAGELWMIESGNRYRIPVANLDSTADRLLLYQQQQPSGQRLYPVNLAAAAPVIPSTVRLHEIISLSIIGQRYYFVQTVDTYYVFQVDGGLWCDSYDDKLMPWQLTAMPHPTKSGRELWVGLKQTLEEKPASRRVIFTPLQMKPVRSYQNSEGVGGGEVTCNIVEFNFPGEDMGDFKPVPPKGAHVFLETVADRSTATFVPSEQSSKTSYKGDLFALPPYVLVTQTKLYMLSVEIERVYVVEAAHLVEALEQKVVKSFKVRSMSWARFFSCQLETDSTARGPAVDDSEPTQAEYLEAVGELYPEEPFRWDWWLEDYAEELIIAGLLFLIFVTLILVALNRGWLPHPLVVCLCCGSDRRARTYVANASARRARRRQQSQKPSRRVSIGSNHSREGAKSSVLDGSERAFQSEVKRMLQIDVTDNSGSKRLAHKSTSRSSESSSQTSGSGSKKIKAPSIVVKKTQGEPEKIETLKPKKLTDDPHIMKWQKIAKERAAAAASASPTSPSPTSNSPSK